jgi:asparagine synthase (glutamine-hydrolysing)
MFGHYLKTTSTVRLLKSTILKKNFHTTPLLNCGLVSVLQQNQSKFTDTVNLEKSLNSLKHRGPDHQGYWVSPGGTCVLGHTRLSIIDLSAAGNQPLHAKSNSIVVNGELYDWERIRGELKKKGYNFTTNSDSEIALHLYEEYGTSMMEHIRGEFAITLWDEKNQLFFAVRDRYGIKPLYYAKHNGKLIFASEIKALFAMGVPRKWNIENTGMSQMMDQHNTLFEGIHQVPAGYYMLATPNGTIKLNRYYEMDYYDRAVPEKRSKEEMIRGVQEKLLEATKFRLRADVPVGVYLSGGLDSSSILGMSAHLLGGHSNINAYSIAFSEQDKMFDEGEIAKRTVKQFGGRHKVIHVTDDILADAMSETLWHTEYPSMNSHSAAKFLLSKTVRDDGLRVVMTGEGSDEIFAGYPFFLWDRVSHSKKSPQEIKALAKTIAERNPAFGMFLASEVQSNQEFVNQIGMTPHMVTEGFISGSRLMLKDELLVKAVGSTHAYYLASLPNDVKMKMKHKWDPMSTSLYISSRSMLYNYLLKTLGDRNEMAHSVEGRLPFLDHHLVDYVNQLPSEMKVSEPHYQEKYVLREAMKPFITEELYKRQKHPFMGPSTKKHSRMDEWVESHLNEMDKISYVDSKKVKMMFKHMESDPKLVGRVSTMKMYVASLVSIQKQFKIE